MKDKPQKIQFNLMPYCTTDKNKLEYIKALKEWKSKQEQL